MNGAAARLVEAPKMTGKIAAYQDFWPYYLREHSRRACRALHYVGTTLAFVLLAIHIADGNPLYFVAAIISGYAFAWTGHFFVEHNRPATFTYPLWSLYSDFRMYAFAITGRLAAELARAGQLESGAETAPRQSV